MLIRKMKLVAMFTVFTALAANSTVLLSEDFEEMNVGDQPTADDIRPVINTDFNSITVVNSVTNMAGTGNGIRFFDDSVAVGTRLGYDFSLGESAVRFDFTAAALEANATLNEEYIAIGLLANGASAGTSANRYAEMRVYATGIARFYSAGSYISNSTIDIGTNTSYKFSLYVNDSDMEIEDYNGPRDLAPNTVDFWVNDSYYLSGDLNGVSAPSTAGLGRIGFASSSSDNMLNYTFDDFVVETISSGPPVDYLLSESYEIGQTPGTQPNGAMNVRPTPNNDTAFVAIVDEANNPAGTGNGVQMFDNASANSSTDITCMEYHFVAGTADQISALRVDFAFAALSADGPGDKYINVGLGEYNTTRTFQSSANRYIDTRLYNDGTIDFRTSSGTNAPSSENNALLAGANTLSIYANDYDAQSVQYTGLDGNTYTLAENSVAYWLNGDLVLMDGGEEYTVLDLGDSTTGGTVGDTENNFGKFGFSSGTSETNLSYVIDDLYITTNILVRIDGYAEWLALYPSLGSSTNYTDDFEPDGMNNLLEYALGGNPTTNDTATVKPAISMEEVSGTAYLNYVYNRRDNAEALGLTYNVYSDTDLVTGSMSTPTEEVGFAAAEPGFDIVTNRVSTSASPQAFMQLQVKITD